MKITAAVVPGQAAPFEIEPLDLVVVAPAPCSRERDHG
jgi:hypothetical protein